MSAPGRIRTDTSRGLSPLPLLLGYESKSGPGGRSCTRTGSVLSGVPLLLGYAGKNEWCSRQESCLQPPRSKRGALYIELRERCGNGAPGRFRPVCLLSVSEAIYY